MDSEILSFAKDINFAIKFNSFSLKESSLYFIVSLTVSNIFSFSSTFFSSNFIFLISFLTLSFNCSIKYLLNVVPFILSNKPFQNLS